ncbi:hypothetical protein Tco_1302185 [Tanacetum coccineum]
MRTRSQARRRRQPQVRQTSVESSNLEKPDNPPIVTMADNRTMAQLLEAPTEGYEDAIVIPEITANNFEIKHGLLNLVRQSRNKAVVAKMSTSSSTQAVSSDVAELKDMVRALIQDRKNQTPASAPVKAVEQSCVTCGGVFEKHANQGSELQSQMANLTDMLSKFVTANTASTSGSGTLPGNTVTNPKEDLKELADRSITEPIGIAEDVFINCGKFSIFQLDFVMFMRARLPSLLARKHITFHLEPNSKYTADYTIDGQQKSTSSIGFVMNILNEVLGFSSVVVWLILLHILSYCFTASQLLTPFRTVTFSCLKKQIRILALEDDPISSEVDHLSGS